MTRKQNGRIVFDDSEELSIVDDFIGNKKSIKAIARAFNVSRSVIIKVLEKHNVDIESSSNKYGRKYFFDEYYFDQIDSEEKAYWLGFLYADGYLTNNNMIGCGLRRDDEQHIVSFLQDIKMSQINLCYSDITNSCRFNLTSQTMYDSLLKKGFSRKKSYDNTSLPFDCVPDNFKRYFILGFWDGDGYVSITNGKKLTGVVSNNEKLLLSFMKYINGQIEDDFCKVINSDGYFRIRMVTNKAKRFLDWLYFDSRVHMQRKYNIYLQMTFGTQKHIGFDNYKTKGILCIESNKMYVTAKECAIEEFGANNPGLINNIRACCRGEQAHTRNKHFRYLTEEERELYKCQV